jgi:hypothetical protein
MTEVKKCRYFKIHLGLASTFEKNGQRIMNERDPFSFFYNNQYRTTIYGQGNVGDIKFYVDHFIKELLMAIYVGSNNEEFIISVDFKELKEKGIDGYLGSILKKVEEQYEERVRTETEKKMEPKKEGNADIVTINPGAVTYQDLKAYIEKSNKQRYNNL